MNKQNSLSLSPIRKKMEKKKKMTIKKPNANVSTKALQVVLVEGVKSQFMTWKDIYAKVINISKMYT